MVSLFFRWFEHRNVYHPSPREWWADGGKLGRPWEDIRFQAADGTQLSGWYYPADPATRTPFADLVVLIHHGNAGNISHRFGLYRLLLDLGANVFAYDYRGYGRSDGRPSEAGTYLDADAALSWLVSRGFSESRIVVHGESLGGGISVEQALRHPGLRGVILRSTFTSIPDLGRELFPFLPVRQIATIHYHNHAKLPNVHVPVLLLHSRSDTLIRFAHAEANFAAANEPRFLREILGDHNEQPEASPQAYAQAIREFLEATTPR